MEQPPFDQALADSYIGKYILVGLTYRKDGGRNTYSLQLHGIIKSASPNGILIELKGTRNGDTWNMPPSLEAIKVARPGIYQLKETGEKIENPDLTAVWTIEYPKED